MSGVNAFFWVLAVGLSLVAATYIFAALASLYDEWASGYHKRNLERQMAWLAKRSKFENGAWTTEFNPRNNAFWERTFTHDVHVNSSDVEP
jgi:hypothetical protein